MSLRILVVDNYDSFVYNLVQYLAQLGARTVVRRNDEPDAADVRRRRRGADQPRAEHAGVGRGERAGRR